MGLNSEKFLENLYLKYLHYFLFIYFNKNLLIPLTDFEISKKCAFISFNYIFYCD